MIRLWDYGCDTCGKKYPDYPVEGKRIPETIVCECGKKASWATKGGNHLHTTRSSMYGRYEPGLGQYVESYEHKKKLMKELDVIEGGDTVGGSRCHRPSAEEMSPRAVNENAAWMDKDDFKKAEREALNRARQGKFDVSF